MSTHVMTRRDEIISAVITTWVVSGLFLDGWAHNVDKPETFFTPWHGVLYSGFLAGALARVYERRRALRRGERPTPVPPAMQAGFVLFAVGGVADMVWHEIFGIEESVEALLSPTHLMLMVGGLLLTTATVRSMLGRTDGSPALRDFVPALVGVTMALAIVGFFLQFVSAFRIEDHAFFDAGAEEGEQIYGIASILVTNVIVLGTVAWTLLRFRPPRGTFTVVLGGAALLLTSLQAFDGIALVAPALVAGVVADALVAQGRSARTVLLVTPAVLWTGWVATYHLVWGLGWPVELWSGSIAFAVLTGYGIDMLQPNMASNSRPDRDNEAKNEVGNGSGNGAARAPRTPYRVLAELLT